MTLRDKSNPTSFDPATPAQLDALAARFAFLLHEIPGVSWSSFPVRELGIDDDDCGLEIHFDDVAAFELWASVVAERLESNA